MKTRLAVILITALVTALVVGGGIGVYAATYTKDLPATANVVTANPTLKFYSDAACTSTTEVTTLAFGDVIQGDSSAVPLYVKNTGNKNLSNINATSNIDPNVGTITYSMNSFALDKGASRQIIFTFTPKLGGTMGEATPTISYTSSY